MAHYLDIKILPDPEFSEPVLMNALFAKLHRALVANDASDIGVSFPKAEQNKKTNLGTVLRLHSKQTSLDALEALNWRKGLSDYTQVRGIEPTPLVREYRLVKRIQPKSSAERLRRRAVRKLGISAEDAWNRIPDSIEQTLSLPFVSIKSRSTEQQFRLFIDQSQSFAQRQAGKFSKYGLSLGATIPWF